jgi:hypothetical protein
VANKKRAPPNFSWLEVYNPQLVWESGSDSEPVTSTATETDSSSHNCHDAIPAHLNQKTDSELSSPDVTAHRSSIATGMTSLLFRYIYIGLHYIAFLFHPLSPKVEPHPLLQGRVSLGIRWL